MNSVKQMMEICSSPVGLLCLLFVLGVLASVLRPASRTGLKLLVGGSGLYLLFVCTPIAEVLYAQLEDPYPSMLEPDVSVRKVVVLAGYARDLPYLPVTNKLTEETIARTVEGIRLYKAIPEAKLILSGGVLEHSQRSVGDVMAEFARSMGVPDRDVIVEGSSLTTYENLVEVKQLVGSEPFILVTSAGHLRRSEAVARKLRMTPLPAPAAIWALKYHAGNTTWTQWIWKVLSDIGMPNGDRLVYLQRVHHEYVGYVWYWMRGRV